MISPWYASTVITATLLDQMPYFCAPIAPYIAPIIAFIENFIKISSLV